jgi:hypothetical protein
MKGSPVQVRASALKSPVNSHFGSGHFRQRQKCVVDRPRTAGGGYFTKRTAEDWLRDLLCEARRGTLPPPCQDRRPRLPASADDAVLADHRARFARVNRKPRSPIRTYGRPRERDQLIKGAARPRSLVGGHQRLGGEGVGHHSGLVVRRERSLHRVCPRKPASAPAFSGSSPTTSARRQSTARFADSG